MSNFVYKAYNLLYHLQENVLSLLDVHYNRQFKKTQKYHLLTGDIFELVKLQKLILSLSYLYQGASNLAA